MSNLTISEAAEEFGVSICTLRRWEERNYLIPAYTEGGHRRYRESDIITLMSKKVHMNMFYEVWQNGNKVPLKPIDLFLGDELIKSEIGCFEALFVIDDENQIKKMECNFLLSVPEKFTFFTVPHPSCFYLNLPSDLLQKAEPYRYKMRLTTSETIFSLSRFTGYFDKTIIQGARQITDLKKEIDQMRTDEKNRLKTTIDCDGVYETIELPKINKFRCRNVEPFRETQQFGQQGMIFNFYTSVPSILNNITYNTLANCQIDQFHGGTGDNAKSS